MEIKEFDTCELKAYENNPRKNEAAVENVANSIYEFGFKVPIIIDKNKTVVCGHTRLKAAELLKLEKVPCIVADDLTPEQIKAFRLADNKTAELAEWDFEKLDEELNELAMFDFDMSQFGFENTDVYDDLLNEQKIVEDEAPGVDDETEPVCKLGDIWQLGRHRLMCGDSTKKESVKKLMGGEIAEMILSDPPYGMHLNTDFSNAIGSIGSIGRKQETRENKYDKVIGDNDDFSPELINTFFENFKCKEMFLFGADYFAELLPNKNDGSWLCWDKRKESQANAIGSEFELIWSKNKHKRRMLRHDWFGFLSSKNAKDAQHRVHPTQKPITLLADIINQWGSNCNNIVDLYGGSGSTLIACEQLNRNCFMMELDPKYCDVIIKRWEQYTGEKALKL